MKSNKTATVTEEAAKLLKDYPHLKFYEAIEKAKEILNKEASKC